MLVKYYSLEIMSLHLKRNEGNSMETLDITRSTMSQQSEVDITDFELIMCSVYEAFNRWQETCYEAIGGESLTGQELSVLHSIRLNGRPKTLSDIATILNRNDNFNIQYCTNKLLKLGLIEKIKQPKQKNVFLQITQDGIKITTKFAVIKNKVLLELFKKENINLTNCSGSLEKIKTIYDKASRVLISYK
jgi:predicted MarR family transcription regulator